MDIGSILENIGFDFRVFLFNTINFTILIYLLKRFLFDKVVGILEQRARIVKQGLDDAQNAKEQLDNAEAKRTEIIEQAKVRKEEIIDEASKKAELLLSNAKEKADRDAQFIVNKANLDSMKSKEKIMNKVASELATIVTKELEDKIVK